MQRRFLYCNGVMRITFQMDRLMKSGRAETFANGAAVARYSTAGETIMIWLLAGGMQTLAGCGSPELEKPDVVQAADTGRTCIRGGALSARDLLVSSGQITQKL